MKATALIDHLRELVAADGDLEVQIFDPATAGLEPVTHADTYVQDSRGGCYIALDAT